MGDDADRGGAAATLTPRQLEIARIAARGTPSRRIADRFVLSVRTVENHLHRVYVALEVRSRAELEARLVELGLLDDADAG